MTLHDFVVKKQIAAQGTLAPEINLSTPEGGTLALSSLRGQYVLVDFWASWCGPCRRENPNNVILYNKYHSMGLEFYGVSLDSNKDKWKDAPAKAAEMMYKRQPNLMLGTHGAIKEDFTSDEYAQMIAFVLAGSRLIGMHETSLYAKNNKRYPGVGAILKMLEFATSCAYAVVGKPSKPFFDEALACIKKQNANICFKDISIISDDMSGDLIGAQELGMKGIFVLSGKYRTGDEILPQLRLNQQPYAVYEDMQEVLESL